MTGGGAGFIFGFVGRTDAASTHEEEDIEVGNHRDRRDDSSHGVSGGGGHEVWASYAADASLLAGLNKTAVQVLAKHRSDAPGMYSLPFDGQANACYTLVKVPCPPSKVFSLHDTTPLPSQHAAGGSSSAPPQPRVVFGVIVHAPAAAAEGDARESGGPTPQECTRWLEALSETFERKYGVAAYSAPRGSPFEAFGRRIKEHASSLRRGGGSGGGGGGGAVLGKIQEVNHKMKEVRLTMVDNIARVIERGEKLDDVLVKSDSLQSTASMFKRTATRLKNRMWWQNVKMWLAVAAVVVIVIIIVFLAACKGVACVA